MDIQRILMQNRVLQSGWHHRSLCRNWCWVYRMLCGVNIGVSGLSTVPTITMQEHICKWALSSSVHVYEIMLEEETEHMHATSVLPTKENHNFIIFFQNLLIYYLHHFPTICRWKYVTLHNNNITDESIVVCMIFGLNK